MRAKAISRPAVLFWGARSRADLYQDDWVRRTCEAMPTLRYVPVLSDPKPDDQWHGRTGFVHLAVMHDLPDLSGHQVYACGVPVMVESAKRDFTATCGLPADEFYADAFTSELDKHP
jgi:CDP-4-dehydro-6-deoxyglucose reductase